MTLAATLCIACGPDGPATDSGVSPLCGDGTKDQDELCDDGNQSAGDGCTAECLLSGMPVDCVDLLVSDNLESWNSIRDLLPLADGTFIAAGQLDVPMERRGWLARYEPSGARWWFVETTSIDTEITGVIDLAGSDQAGIWALSSTGSTFDDRIIRFDQDGSATNTAIIQSEAGTSVDVKAIEVTSAGVWLAGRLEDDAWLGLFDPTLNTVRDVLREDHVGYIDSMDVVVRDGDGDGVVAAATVSTSPNFDSDVPLVAKTDILVIWFDPQGNELRRTMVGPSNDPEYVRSADQLTSDGSGRWYVGGYLEPDQHILDTLGQAWAAQVESEWSWVTSDLPSVGWGDMVGLDDGVLVATNRYVIESNTAIDEGWLREFEPGGSVRWEFSRVGDGIADYEEFNHRVLVREADGRIRTAGIVSVTGEPQTIRSCLISR